MAKCTPPSGGRAPDFWSGETETETCRKIRDPSETRARPEVNLFDNQPTIVYRLHLVEVVVHHRHGLLLRPGEGAGEGSSVDSTCRLRLDSIYLVLSNPQTAVVGIKNTVRAQVWYSISFKCIWICLN